MTFAALSDWLAENPDRLTFAVLFATVMVLSLGSARAMANEKAKGE